MPRSRVNQVLLTLRRLHLYSGMLLLPWALLYGVTALLFNHPGLMGREEQHVRFEQPLLQLPEADTLGREVVTALAAVESRDLSFVPASADLSGEAVFFCVQGGEAPRTTIRYEWGSREATLTQRTRSEAPEGALSHELELASLAPLRDAKATIAPLVSQLELKGRAQLAFAPTLRFRLQVGDELHDARYDLRRGRLTTRPADQPRPQGLRSFLTRLHLTHGYGSGPSRWGWALLVDLMGVGLVFWALSGLAMALQMAKLRRRSLLLAGGGSLLFALLAAGIWTLLSR